MDLIQPMWVIGIRILLKTLLKEKRVAWIKLMYKVFLRAFVHIFIVEWLVAMIKSEIIGLKLRVVLL